MHSSCVDVVLPDDSTLWADTTPIAPTMGLRSTTGWNYLTSALSITAVIGFTGVLIPVNRLHTYSVRSTTPVLRDSTCIYVLCRRRTVQAGCPTELVRCAATALDLCCSRVSLDLSTKLDAWHSWTDGPISHGFINASRILAVSCFHVGTLYQSDPWSPYGLGRG